MNNKAINLMQLPDDDDNTNACTIRPHFDEKNSTVKNSEGMFVPEYRMFVDNLLSAIPRHLKNTRHFITSSIKLVYILFRYPVPITAPDLPPTMSWVKMADRAVGLDRLSLGVEFLNCHLEMTVDDYKVERLLELLNTEWSAERKSFTVLTAAVHIRDVYAATLTCTWLRWSLHQLIGATKVLIRANYHQLAQTRHFDDLHTECNKQWLDPPTKSFARHNLPQLVNYESSVAVKNCPLSHQSHSYRFTLQT